MAATAHPDLLRTARARLDAGAALTIPEVAALLGVARKTVEWWRYQAAHGLGDPPQIGWVRYGGAIRATAASVAVVMAGASTAAPTLAPVVAMEARR